MLYVTHVSTRATRLTSRVGTVIVARVSTRPFDHHAAKRRFTPDAWRQLIEHPGTLYRPKSNSRYLHGAHPAGVHK